ncbi:ankyrin repeat-containing protein ITN1-like [Vitis vinifera]|uniref:ankyrin repeat-containing protein ITN1-like n=1 Tax=Vitis vinifera TaxID=29760 RepID=UPI0008FF98E9|nr:ankyrin repeat-containing protein ITN1-like [Vitis vinifera]|eukprot:XP_019075300.1 PREDICTED: ankyrin repeat-containing protein ITN1-like [Vitis vinifera]
MVISIQPTVPLFQGNGYDSWSIKMRTLFISEDLWELVDKGYAEEEIPRDAMRDVRKNDAKALFFIQQAITDSIFPQISKATKSKEAWDTLQTKYQSTSLVAAQDGDGSQTDIPVMDDSVYKAAAKGDIEVLKKIPESQFHAQLTPKHNTILHIASEFGQTECVKWILTLPACSSLLQCPNLNGDTVLHLAAREGHLKVVEALLEPTLDIETGVGEDKEMLIGMTNKGKNTALHEAVRFNHSDVVESLIEKDPRFNYRANDSGTTPLYMAAERGLTGLVVLIIDKSSTSPSYHGLMGRTALHAAVLCNNEAMTNKILEWKPDLTKEVDKNGWSPLHYAAERGCDLKIVELLLSKSEKSVAYLRSKDGKKTALHIASFHHHTKIVEEILSHSPGCREQVDDKGNNIFHFAMMKKGDRYDDFKPSNYFDNKWLGSRGPVNGPGGFVNGPRGLVNEKNAQGNTPIHLLSLNQISDSWFVWNEKVDKKAYNNEDLTGYDIILRADISEKKENIQVAFEYVMTESRSSVTEKETKRRERKKERKEYISQLQKQGETHLIVSALITTVTFAAGFTLPGGYKEDDGQAILSKKAAFRAFVVTDTIAMVSSLCAVLLHFFMTMRQRGEYLEKHLLWAFSLTMVGMGAMAIAFATGSYAVLPHSSGLSFLTCIICSCFFLSIAVEYCLFWRGTISEFTIKIIHKILLASERKENADA